MIVWPILTPFAFAILTVLLWSRLRAQRIIAVVGSIVLAVVALANLNFILREGIQSLQIGNWPSPFGITLVIDQFSAIMLTTTGVVALAIVFYSQAQMDNQRLKFGFYPLFFFLLMGVNGAFTAGDLFNLYVWFEVMLLSSFVMIALGGERPQIEGAVKYVILNLLSSILFLSAIGLLYNLAGTLNLADLAWRLRLV
ncbi:MAG TPA: proton-conducting transporter membrane subunit, partial [Anaerolinea sp.]|nr:proton-conducting transporter membrane subunit [Anaerolinea sp.]